MPITLRVNGQSRTVDVDESTPLLYVLADELGQNGPKFGCGLGQCGACTVIVNGRSMYSCTQLAVQAVGAEVLTIEGMARDERLHPIQQAFAEHSGYQCGFCTSGQIMSSKALLDRVPNPTEDQVRQGLCGNLCRCAAYKKILESVMAASRLMRA